MVTGPIEWTTRVQGFDLVLLQGCRLSDQHPVVQICLTRMTVEIAPAQCDIRSALFLS